MRAVNLIPAERRAGGPGSPSRSGGAVYVLLGGLAGLVIMAGVWALAHQQAGDRRAQARQATVDAGQADARAARLAGYRQFADLRDRRLQAISALAAQRFDWSSVMREVASVLPSDVRLISFTGSVTPGQTGAAGAPAAPGSPVPGAPAASAGAPAGAASAMSGDGPMVQLTGCARGQSQVADVINRLRAIHGVKDVALAASEKDAQGSSGSGCSRGTPQFSVAISFSGTSGAAGAPGSPPATAPRSAAAVPATSAGSPPVPATTAGSPPVPATTAGSPPAPASPTSATPGASSRAPGAGR